MNNEVKQNSLRAWILAARPKTLTGACIPVMVATALAWSDGNIHWAAAVACLLFAVLMQIAANMINDLIDFLKGSDRADRLGPERACAQGWITPKAMRWGIVVVLVLAAAVGLSLLRFGNFWVLMSIGAACIVFAFLYTTLLSYLGLGDLLVLVFFGLVPVTATYYVESGHITTDAVLAAFICGILIDTLLVINNYRDRDTDRRDGKRTLIAMFGECFGRYFYLVLGLAAWALTLPFLAEGRTAACVFPMLYIPLHLKTWFEMVHIRQGKALNRILGKTSRNMFFFAVLLAGGLLVR